MPVLPRTVACTMSRFELSALRHRISPSISGAFTSDLTGLGPHSTHCLHSELGKFTRMLDARRSKRLSYWLRHAPDAAGIGLDWAGWAPTEAVLLAFQRSGLPTTMADLEMLTASSDKQRFEISSDRRRIRARQGHSVTVVGDWPVATPPAILYHGTVERFLEQIMEHGLTPQRRHHVHLSSTIETAQLVGGRRGKPVVLMVAAARMAQDGFSFRLSSNGVWLAENVPPTYLQRAD